MAISFFFSVLLILKHHSVSRVCVLPLLKWARNSIASLMPFVLSKPQWAGQSSLVLFLRPVYSGRLSGLKSEKFIYILPTGGHVTPLKASVDRWKWQQHSISKLLFQELAWWPWGSHTKCSPVSCVLMTEMEIVWNGNMSWRKTYWKHWVSETGTKAQEVLGDNTPFVSFVDWKYCKHWALEYKTTLLPLS